MPRIVAFGYSKRAGKDSSAKFLDSYLRVARPGLKVKKISFASKLKDISYQLFGWAGIQPGVFYETEAGEKVKEVMLPKLGKSPRQVWIELGNKVREIYPDAWLDHALLGVTADIIIITDLRFPNEGNKINDLGGWCYRLDRPGIERGHDAAEVSLDNWIGWRGILLNDGTLSDLNDKVVEIGKELLL